MDKQKILFFGSSLVVLGTIFLLATGSRLLTLALDWPVAIPLGTFITWAGMICLPLAIHSGIDELQRPTGTLNKILLTMLRAALFMAILWVPISYFLAGNMSFTFSDKASFQGSLVAMQWFWRLSYGIAVTPVMVLLIYWLSLLARKRSDRLS